MIEQADDQSHQRASAPARMRVRELIAKIEAMPLTRSAWFALGVFALISLSIYWPQVPGATHSVVGCPCGDVMQEVWFLKWTPWAIVHGHNPMFTNWLAYPTGVDLASNTYMPGLAILVAPWTWLLGPVSSYNLLMWLSFPASAFACFYVVRRLSGSNVGAFLGGALYGFSPYMIGQGYSHLFLLFVPLPPLIFYAIFRICVTQEGSARKWGLILAALVIMQFLVSQELAADALVIGFIGLVILGVSQRHYLDAVRIRYVGRAARFAAGVSLLVLAYPVYFEVFGPQAVYTATHGTSQSPFKLDVLGTLIPTRLQLLAPSFLTHVGNQFVGGFYAENGAYLGVPLVASLAVIVWTLRRQRWVLYVALLLVVSEVLSLGRWLTVANHTINVPMPWAVLAQLPLLKSDLPNRLALFASFWVAVLVALGVARWIAWAASQPRSPGRDVRRVTNVALSALAVLSVAVYVPRLRIPTSPLPKVPAFFTSSDVRQIPGGSVVLAFPLSSSPSNTSMYWQILSGLRWKMIGGDAIIPGQHGIVNGPPADLRPVAVKQFLWHYAGARTRLPDFNQVLVVRMREFLYINNVGTVVLDPSAADADKVRALFAAAMGPARNEGGVNVWFHAQSLAHAVASAQG